MAATVAPSRSALARTPLTDWHESHGGRLVDFAGWAMPIQYGSIVDEHVATRTGVGLFDVSHMGRFRVEGPAAERWLDRLLTRRVEGTPIGRVRYSLVCNEAGGVLDDVLFTRVGEERFDLVVNASNRAKLLDWFAAHAMAEATLTDRTEATAMIAVQGPQAVAAAAGLADADVSAIRYYRAGEAKVAGVDCVVSRTGYTGEDGYELICNGDNAASVWRSLIETGAAACGLAARDTLRLEAGMPLYGHELTEEIDPLQAGLGFAVDFESADGAPRDFLGREALVAARSDRSRPQRVGLLVDGRRPPREGYPVFRGGEECGWVTSGTHSPTLGKPIAMAYVRGEADPGDELAIDIRGTETPAEVTETPFYTRTA